VILGKLNLTQFDFAWYSPEFPPPLNPWNPKLWPGASSSGSGVATAAGLCFGSIGTDTAGSIRSPRRGLRNRRTQADVGPRQQAWSISAW
jgi:amidase